MEAPKVKHMSIRLQAMHREGQPLTEAPKDLAFALYFILDVDGKFEQYGHAYRLSRERFEELFKTGELLIDEKEVNQGPIDDGQMMPVTEP